MVGGYTKDLNKSLNSQNWGGGGEPVQRWLLAQDNTVVALLPYICTDISYQLGCVFHCSCDMVTQKTEKIYDFALQLPKGYVLGSAEKASDTLVKIEFS